MKATYRTFIQLSGLLAMLALIVSATGCASVKDSQHAEEGETRVITDLTGTQVRIPAAEHIDRMVIIAPSLVPTYLSIVEDQGRLVGTHPMFFALANPVLLNELLPDWQEINTTFLTGFTANTEELLKLAPDLILVWGAAQKEGLDKINIPVVDFYEPSHENEQWSVGVDRLMRDIFQVESGKSLQEEWTQSNKTVSAALAQIKESDKQTAIMIMNNTGDLITVRGGNTYGDDWLKKSGLINLAESLTGGENNPVTMEQIYEWDPDIIYLFQGEHDHQAYLTNAITGQDWSKTKAFANERIYKMPVGTMNWGTPSSDSPLTLEWLVKTNYPETMDHAVFLARMKAYYKEHYSVELSEEVLERMVNP